MGDRVAMCRNGEGLQTQRSQEKNRGHMWLECDVLGDGGVCTEGFDNLYEEIRFYS